MSADWAPPPVDESLKAAYASRTRKPRPGILAGADVGLFEAKRPPGPNDWLNGPGVKDRNGQSFAQWNMERRRRPQRGDVIRLVPLGDIDSDCLDLEWLVQCVQCFFTGMTVQVLPAFPTSELLKRITHREDRGFGTQLLTADIHAHLESVHGKQGRVNAFATMAFTLFDLYPRPEWNFVFGQARQNTGTGVFSFARYQRCSRKQFHLRCAKVLCHELGHLFGLMHCIWFQCLMCGSNGDWESDQHPVHVCPVCLAKLDAALGGLNLVAREASLEEFWERSGYTEEAVWCQRRREAMERTASTQKGRPDPDYPDESAAACGERLGLRTSAYSRNTRTVNATLEAAPKRVAAPKCEAIHCPGRSGLSSRPAQRFGQGRSTPPLAPATTPLPAARPFANGLYADPRPSGARR